MTFLLYPVILRLAQGWPEQAIEEDNFLLTSTQDRYIIITQIEERENITRVNGFNNKFVHLYDC